MSIAANATSVTAYYGDPTNGSPVLSAAATGLTTGTQTETITLVPTKLVFTTQPVSGTAASSAKLGPITVQEQSSGSVPTIVAETVNLSSSSGTGLFSLTPGGAPVTSVTIPAGSSNASFYYGDTTAGHPTITASSGTLTPATQGATINVGPVSAFKVTTPTPATPTAGSSFTATITATDAVGNTVTTYTGQQTVLFSGPTGSPNGTQPVYPATVTFNAGSGIATITLYDAQTTALTATAGTLTGSSANFTVNPAAMSAFSLSTPSPTAGTQFTENLTASDPYGNVATTYTGTQCITFSGPHTIGANAPIYPGRGTGGNRCATGISQLTFNNGTAAAPITLFDAETVTLTATQGSLSGSTLLTVASAAASSLTVTNPGTQTAGTSFNLAMTMTDQYGNGVSGAQNVTFSGPANAPDGTAPSYPSTVTLNNAGQGTALITLYAAQTNVTLTVHDGSVAGSSTFTVKGGSLNKFTLPTPATQTAGTAFNETVTATDAWGNTVTTFTGSQCIVFSGPGSSPSGKPPTYPAGGVGCTTGSLVTFTNGAGSASITLYAAQSNTTLTATQGALSGTTGTFIVTNNAAVSTLTIPTTPGTQTAGTPFSPTIDASDAYGNPYNGNLAVTFSGPGTSPAPSSRAPTYPATVTFANGVGSPSITLYDAQTNIKLTATSGAASGTSPAFSVNPAASSQLAFTTQPGGTVAEGTAFTQPVLTAEDAFNNTVTGFASPVTLQVATYAAGTSGGSTQGSVTNCTANPATPVSGVATFAGCQITGPAAAGSYTLKATGGSLTSANSSTVSITAGNTSALTFSTQPAGTVGEGTNFTTQPSVTAKDTNGNTVSGASVTLSIATYAAGNGGNTQGTLGCNNNTVTTGTNGVATFAGCDISGTAAAGTYSFKATSGAVTSANSNTVSITAGSAASLTFTNPPTGTVGEGTNFTGQPVVIAQDASGNAVGGAAVTLAVAGYTAGGGGHTQGTLSCTTNPVTTSASGVATFAGCQITGPAAAGTYSFKATSGALTANATGSVTIVAGATATQLLFTTQPGGTVAEGTAFTQPVLTAEDANGNTVTGFASPVTLQVATYAAGTSGGSTQGTVTNCTANPATPVSGVATFAGCQITGPAAAGSYTLKATGGSLTSANSSTVSITAGNTSALTFSTQPAGTVGEGANFTTQPSVTAKDTNGNTVSGASVTLSIATYAAGNGGNTQGTLGCNNNTVTTGTNGVATFAGCDISGTAAAGTYSFKATSGAVTSANSNTVSITAGNTSALTFSTQPAGTVGEGTNFTTQPSVTAKDANGNTVSGASVTLGIATYAAGTSGGSTQGALGCTTNPVTTSASGVATFAGCQITGPAAAGTYSFSATSGAVTSANSSTVSITAGNTSALTFSTQPAGTVGEGTNFTTQPSVTAKDTNGNTVSGASVTLSIATYAAGNGGNTQGTLGCNNNTVTTGTNGVATFAGCDISGTAAAGTYSFKRHQWRGHLGQLEHGQHHGRKHVRPDLQHPARRHRR